MTSSTATESGVVQLDALVVFKIIKHCTESLPDLVTGQLLGLDVDNTLEITNCFPFPNKVNDDNNDELGARYQIEMMDRLRDINVDSNTIGWYQSTYLGFLNEPIIFTQFNYQKNIEDAVVIVYDPCRSQQSNGIALRAFRLSALFMSVFDASKPLTPETVKEYGLTRADMFDELPIQVKSAPLVQTLLSELELPHNKPDTSSKFKIGFHAYTEKNLERLIDRTDELTSDQSKYQYYLRNVMRQKSFQKQLASLKLENEQRLAEGLPLLNESEMEHNVNKVITPPNRLESMITANQLYNDCKHLDSFAKNNFTKFELLSAFQKDTDKNTSLESKSSIENNSA